MEKKNKSIRKQLVKMTIPQKPKREEYTEIEAYDQELQDMIFEDNLMEMRY